MVVDLSTVKASIRRAKFAKLTLEEAVQALIQETDLESRDDAEDFLNCLRKHRDGDINLNDILYGLNWSGACSASTLLDRLRHDPISFGQVVALIAESWGLDREVIAAYLASLNPPIIEPNGEQMSWGTAPILEKIRASDYEILQKYSTRIERLRALILFDGKPEPFPQWWLPAMKGIEETATFNEEATIPTDVLTATPPTEVTIATTPSKEKKPTIHQQRKQALADFLKYIVDEGRLNAEDLPFQSVGLIAAFNQKMPNFSIKAGVNDYIFRNRPFLESIVGRFEFTRNTYGNDAVWFKDFLKKIRIKSSELDIEHYVSGSVDT